MPFRCSICSEAFTSNGTEHALCSTKCGHLFGKSCLEKWICEKRKRGRFNCPVCREHLQDSDHHLIYDVPDEVLKITSDDIDDRCRNEEDIMRRCVLGTLKEKHFFIKQDSKKGEELDDVYIHFFDAYNGYILIVCSPNTNDSDDVGDDTPNTNYFLRIYEGDRMCYNKDFKSGDITTVALNKDCEDYLEFCVGLKNGVIHNTVLSSSNGIYGTPHESILFNENEEINSICYLGQNDIVYSVGNCGIYNIHIECLHLKKNWFENVDVNLSTVTNLKAVNDSTLFGIMDNKIYVFGKNITPYEIYSNKNLILTAFEYDSVSKQMLVNGRKHEDKGWSQGNLNLVLLSIKRNRTFETKDCTRGRYINYSTKKFSCRRRYRFGSSLPIFTKRCGENLTYTFIPHFGSNTLRVYAVNNGFIELASGEIISRFFQCIRIVALDKPQFFTSKMLKIPFAIVYENYFKIYNFYTSIESDESGQL